MKTSIDIVILWVDDEDQDWKEEKRFWEAKDGILSKQEERYRNWDNLHYLFRGIEKYAPWVNCVFLVTDNQRPKWLNEAYEKVKVVDHKELINPKYLPTYNSQSIELNIHRIDGLSENFIYFNDDMFLIKDTKPDDFFVNGVPRDTAIANVLVPKENELIHNVTFNNISIINDNFNKYNTIKSAPFKWFNFKYGINVIRTLMLLPWGGFTGFIEPHICAAYNKKTFEIVWEKYEEELLNTTKSKFRENHNYNQWLIRNWQLASNEFVPRRKKFGKVFSLTDTKSTKDCVNHILNQKSETICVNDNELLEDFLDTKKQVNNAFEFLLPEKSKFEK